MNLSEIKSPQDVKSLKLGELNRLAEELRSTIIERVSRNGGHLASNLGAIEMTIALHYVFNSPEDKIIWDVGHQSYAHKILTGRHERFHTLRKHGGISGFPNRSESPHDPFGTGHSSTSISAALGILEGRDRIGKDFKVIAVIGDGAMTAGLAFEGLNHAGHLKKDLIVLLNDNEMSISKNVGALSSYLTRILSGELFQRFKKETKHLMEIFPRLGEHFSKFAQKTEDTIKYFFLPGMLFEELGFSYVGPVDGHNIEKLIDTFNLIKNNTTPTLIHAVTKKGKGYRFSEDYPSTFHGIGPFEKDTGGTKKDGKVQSFSSAFGDAVVEIAQNDPRIIAITAAMAEGTGLDKFADSFPERFYDVGIAEPHAVTFAAGLAIQGLKPVVAIYSTFLQRAYDEIVHDVCLQKLPVIFAVDRAGIVGEDGPTHQGVFDLSYLRHIPNLTIMSPINKYELKEMIKLAIQLDMPSVIRYPRGNIIDETEFMSLSPVEYGKAEIIKDGHDLAILAIGQSVYQAYRASKRLSKDGISTMVVNMRFIKPFDSELISSLVEKKYNIITVEENVIAGGFGSSLIEYLNSIEERNTMIKTIGLPDTFIEHGDQETLRRLYGIDENGIYETAISIFKNKVLS